MVFFINFTDDGADIRVIVNWQRLRAFARNLAITIWAVASLLVALKTAGINLLAYFGL